MAKTVVISLRTSDLEWCERQMALSSPSMIAGELTAAAMKLLHENYRWQKPLRGIGIRGANLIPLSDPRQLNIFADERKREKLERLEYAVDDIRRRFGHRAIGRALLSSDNLLGKLNPKLEHTIHPVGYLG
jgi:DNA polymerase-4